jgi:hypothetical protein
VAETTQSRDAWAKITTHLGLGGAKYFFAYALSVIAASTPGSAHQENSTTKRENRSGYP